MLQITIKYITNYSSAKIFLEITATFGVITNTSKSYCILQQVLTPSWRRPLSYRNQYIDLQSKSMYWFLYDNGLRHERVKYCSVIINYVVIIQTLLFCIFPYWDTITAWKVSKYGVIYGPYFPVFSPDRRKYGPEVTPYLDTFHTVNGQFSHISNYFFDGYFNKDSEKTLFILFFQKTLTSQ